MLQRIAAACKQFYSAFKRRFLLNAIERAEIDELRAAADREWTSAQTPTGRGGTILTEFRDMLLGRARAGHSLPTEWHHVVDDDFQTICLRQRLEAYGTTEWHKAYPWLIEIKRKNGTLR